MRSKKHPNVSELFRQRAAHRRELAQMPVAQKLETAAKLRAVEQALAATRAANKARLAARRANKPK